MMQRYKKMKCITVRLEEELLQKLHAVAAASYRSVNGQITVLVRRAVESFEREHGAIRPGEK